MYEKDGIVYAGTLEPLLKVIAVQPLDGYRMHLEFSTGKTRVFDFTPLVGYSLFPPLTGEVVI
ncbi:MAG: DUF2442 domain-containing protein [Spirochaetaceae bacterium]|jgi:hypothetical protein|nr:DUF2442 domain-containing protein [Spirochaetaceae bacterium]